ncbi:MAG: dicarboxylate/amino acid:cation symporter [Myxococcota bacterium]
MKLHTKILIGMFIGVLLGLLFGPNGFVLPHDGVQIVDAGVLIRESASDTADPAPLSERTRKAVVIGETPEWIEVQWALSAPELVRLRNDGAAGSKTAIPGQVLTGFVPNDPAVSERYSTWGAAIVGVAEVVGQVFLRLIRMVVIPLVFLSLVVGVASLGDLRSLGRLGSRTLGFFFVSTLIALTIGVGLANLAQPGALLSDADKERLLRSFADDAGAKLSKAADAPGFLDQIVQVIPTNPIAAMAEGDMLQIIVFAALFGIALTFMKTDRAAPVVDLFDRLNDAMIMLVHMAMTLAPYGVAALLFKVAGTTGLTVLLALLGYALVVVVGLLLHMVLTYGLVVTFGARLNPFKFMLALREALLVAFSTSSSSATLPVTKECVEENMNVSPRISSFVLPLGATVNMDGTALYQGVAALFIAQIYTDGLDLTQQLTIVGSATLASVGAAGVPGAGMITLVMVLTAVGVPAEGLALVLGIDRLLDMFRTMVNVTGDASATVWLARLEGDDLRFLTPAADAASSDVGFEQRLADGPHPVPPSDD